MEGKDRSYHADQSGGHSPRNPRLLPAARPRWTDGPRLNFTGTRHLALKRSGVSRQSKFATEKLVIGMPCSSAFPPLCLTFMVTFCFRPKRHTGRRRTSTAASKSKFQNPAFQRFPDIGFSR